MLPSTSITDGIITLRPFQAQEAHELFTAVHESLPELKPWMSWAHDSYSMQEAHDFVAITRARWQENTLFGFAITETKNGSFLGGCSLSHLHPIYHFCNVGYWVRSSRHGEGFTGPRRKTGHALWL